MKVTFRRADRSTFVRYVDPPPCGSHYIIAEHDNTATIEDLRRIGFMGRVRLTTYAREPGHPFDVPVFVQEGEPGPWREVFRPVR